MKLTQGTVKAFKYTSAVFYSAWFLINFLQAAFTQLQEDEAYYWVYSKFLAWGYFDHPPMIGLLIKAGTFLLAGEVGVRLFMVVANTLTILVTEKLIDKKDKVLFYAICLSVAVLQLTGFWAVPDIPLIFFTALFFLSYRNFIRHTTWLNTFLLAIVAACLFYTKYHAVLVVFFSFIAYPQILRNYKIYIAVTLALILYFPHLWWQYQHDWITFRFQLFEKNAEPYNIGITLRYIISQLLVAGPITGFILLFSSFAYKPKTTTERILKFNAVGILLFFLLNTARGNIEANWTAPALIPMLVLTHNYLFDRVRWRRWLFRLLPITILLVIAARIIMIADLIPAPAIVEKFHSWKKWPKELRNKTEGLPVVITNSYQRASMYWFYSGQMTYSLNTLESRANSYNFWPIEDSLLGKKVYLADIYNPSSFQDSIQATLWKIGFSPDTNYHSFIKIRIVTDRKSYTTKSGDSVVVNISTSIPPHYQAYLLSHAEIDEGVKIGVHKGIDFIKTIDCPLTLRQLLAQPHQQLTFSPALPKGEYTFQFGIECFKGYFTQNSFKTKLHIE